MVFGEPGPSVKVDCAFDPNPNPSPELVLLAEVPVRCAEVHIGAEVVVNGAAVQSMLVTGGGDGAVRVWDIRPATEDTHVWPVTRVVASSNLEPQIHRVLIQSLNLYRSLGPPMYLMLSQHAGCGGDGATRPPSRLRVSCLCCISLASSAATPCFSPAGNMGVDESYTVDPIMRGEERIEREGERGRG
jgi:hypothetical protein